MFRKLQKRYAYEIVDEDRDRKRNVCATKAVDITY